MLTLPRRNDLVSQTVTIIRGEITRGNWRERLPSERQLTALLKISRPTLRLALQQLARERLLRTRARSGYDILGKGRRSAASRLQTVHLLSPDPLEQLRHQSQSWIAELRQALLRADCELLMHHGTQYLGPGAVRALQQVVAQNAPGCWLLAHSTRVAQAWFARQTFPVVLAGSAHDGIALPSVQIDVEAACRHAVGVFVRAGHRRIVFLREDTDRAGDDASDRGFAQGAARAGVQARIVRYPRKEPAEIVRVVRRLFAERPAPSALLIATALEYATVSTQLLRLGRRIPEDVSLICREEDNFLSFLLPRPACYVYSPAWFAARLHAHLRKVLNGQAAPVEPTRIEPDYFAGDSVARCSLPG